MYLALVPFLSVIGIPLSAFRIVDGLAFLSYFLMASLLLDIVLVLLYLKRVSVKTVYIAVLLLIPPLIIGLLFNDISRRQLTDFLLPLLFFLKIVIFRHYFYTNNISKFLIDYTRITVIGALFLAPLVYIIFNLFGGTRISILAPLEVGAAFFLFRNPALFILILGLVIFYGKRAQLVAILTSVLLSMNLLKGRQRALLFLSLPIVFSLGLTFALTNPDNISVKRITNSVDLVVEGDYSRLSSGRFDEINAIMGEMSFLDYIFGKGNGYVYELRDPQGETLKVANSHFTPLALLSKYGVFFTVFFYLYIFKAITGVRKAANKHRKILYVSTLIFIFQSFFSYAIFVLPIIPVLIGGLVSYKVNRGVY
ncbi:MULTISPECIES: hypothetical protein [Gammaproteobacteria]|uniref:hypothetical protein n=1 Tax=Gammaproteobacteria TaxID=1236 RepID=UPI000F803542|nr:MULTISPECIES: hypothetical protein [Gammaproteobacteria]RTE86061.1 hypothetical protein DQX04_05680 [Aliidiomarina sp. B3213]TCZ91415.1 hypothetical protein EYQ95_05690 [Lysobacter sp. N42]